MTWTLTDDMDTYLTRAGDYLRAQPVEHTVELTALETMRARGPQAYGSTPPLFGWCTAPAGDSPAGDIAAAFFHTPPYPALLSGGPDAAASLAVELGRRGRELAGVNGPADSAISFSSEWVRQSGVSSSVRRRSRLFRLGQLAVPEPAPSGAARVAGPDDAELLAGWFDAFADEADQREGDARQLAEDRLSHRGLTVWETGGIAVAMAGQTRPAAGVIRIGPVYTPAEHRRRGYGGAATVAVSQAALASGATVVLFTDLANPTSNALYVRLGYRPVTDRLQMTFGTG